MICLGLSCFSVAREVGGIHLPDTYKLETHELQLHGAGIRKKLFLKIYVGGLYLSNTYENARAIVFADEAMVVRLHFIYKSVPAQKLIDTWTEGFEKVTGGNTRKIREEISQFNSFFDKDATKDDTYDVVYRPGKGVEVLFNGKSKGVVGGHDFKKAVFAIWLGDKPADESLKKGMMNP